MSEAPGTDFYQEPPRVTDGYLNDRWLTAYLRYKIPARERAGIENDLRSFGVRCAGPYLALARQAERERPVHVPFDAWGRRIDELRVSTAWDELKNISARERMVAIGYDRLEGEYSRLYQFAKLYLFHPSSAFFSCPLAMTDGAAKVLETYGNPPELREAFAHLRSGDPVSFWTSGQWMTERSGGSDVGSTSTVMRLTKDGQKRLYGTKWFSSATTGEVALALARPEGAPSGARGFKFIFGAFAASVGCA